MMASLVGAQALGMQVLVVAARGLSRCGMSGRLWFFWGGDAREYPGGLLRLDPAFAYAEPPSS